MEAGGFEGHGEVQAEADIEKEYQSMLNANQSVTGWAAVGQVAGSAVEWGSAGFGAPSGKAPAA